jgi:hypothetical protein
VFEMRVKPDEENVDEAHRAAFRAYPFAQIPFEIQALLDSPHIDTLTVDAPVFDRLLDALKAFVGAHGALPLNAALPDMHADTANYVRLQTLYKARANTEKAQFRALVQGDVDDALVDAFVKNAHALRVLHGRRFGELDADKDAIANAVGGATYTREPITHFALSAFAAIGSAKPTLPELRAAFDTLVGPAGADLPEKEVTDCLGEMCAFSLRMRALVLTGDAACARRRRSCPTSLRSSAGSSHRRRSRSSRSSMYPSTGIALSTSSPRSRGSCGELYSRTLHVAQIYVLLAHSAFRPCQ